METLNEFRVRIRAEWGITEIPETEKVVTCYHCGAVIGDDDAVHIYRGIAYCDDCHSEIFAECDICGKESIKQDLVYVSTNGYTVGDTVCPSCLSRHYVRCDWCGDYFRRTGGYHGHGLDLCDSCYEDAYLCSSCGTPLREGDMFDRNGESYCQSCYESLQRVIHPYSYKANPIFHPSGISVGYGVELEIDHGDDRSDCSEELSAFSDGERLFFMKTDGSLEDEGIEIVTHPCSLEYHCNEFPWKEIVETAKRHRYKSHDAGTCGLHVHASRKMFGASISRQDINIAKVMLLFDMFWQSHIVPFSRRNYSSLEHWAKKPDAGIRDSDSELDAVYKAKSRDGDRYQAINLCNSYTVEFRVFRGTLKLDTIKATLQWLDEIIKYAIKTPLKEIWGTVWEDIFKDTTHEELKRYMINKKLFEGD